MIYLELLCLLIHIHQPDWLTSCCNVRGETIHWIRRRRLKLLLRFSMNHHFQILLWAFAQTVVIVVIKRLLAVVDHRDFTRVLLLSRQFLDNAISFIECILLRDPPHLLIVVRLRLLAFLSPCQLARDMLVRGHAFDFVHFKFYD